MAKLVLELPLTEIMIRKVVIHLWSVDESFDLFLLETFPPCNDRRRGEWLAQSAKFAIRRGEWKKAVEKVRAKVSELGVPSTLEKRMMGVVKPIGVEMVRGKLSLMAENFSNSRRDVDIQILKQLCWTNTGELDYQKTADKLVQLETLDVVKRFRFACFNQLEDRIPDLWGALPEEYRKCFDDEGDPAFRSLSRDEYYWYCTLIKGNHPESNPSILEVMFHSSALRANKVGTRYFFRKLTKVERDSCLYTTFFETLLERFVYASRYLDFFPMKSYSGVLHFLLSMMNREELELAVKRRPEDILSCFLDWPLQDLLPDVGDVLWPKISESGYQCVLDSLYGHLSSSGYHILSDAFQKFFLRSPATFKEFFFKHDFILTCLFLYAKDAVTIRVMLGSVDYANRVRFLTERVWIFSIFHKHALDGDYDFIKQCLRGLVELESLEDEERVIEASISHGLRRYEALEWRKLFEGFGEGDASAANKRSSPDEASTRVKKPRSEEERLQEINWHENEKLTSLKHNHRGGI